MRILSLALLVLSSVSHADLYKCIDTEGVTVFTDKKCKLAGGVFKPKPVMTSYKSVTLPLTKIKSAPDKSVKTKGACPFFTSTELRNLRVKEEYKKGMPKSEIKKRYGKADDIESAGNNKEKWKYKGKRFKRTFNFKEGCLSSWTKKVIGKKSKIYTD